MFIPIEIIYVIIGYILFPITAYIYCEFIEKWIKEKRKKHGHNN